MKQPADAGPTPRTFASTVIAPIADWIASRIPDVTPRVAVLDALAALPDHNGFLRNLNRTEWRKSHGTEIAKSAEIDYTPDGTAVLCYSDVEGRDETHIPALVCAIAASVIHPSTVGPKGKTVRPNAARKAWIKSLGEIPAEVMDAMRAALSPVKFRGTSRPPLTKALVPFHVPGLSGLNLVSLYPFGSKAKDGSDGFEADYAAKVLPRMVAGWTIPEKANATAQAYLSRHKAELADRAKRDAEVAARMAA